MERITTQMTVQTTLADLNSGLSRLDTTQQELSSGLRINEPSDDPYGTSLAMELNGQLAGLTSYSNNVTGGTGWTQAASTALSDINNVTERVRELTVEAANGTNSQANLSSMADEVDQLKGEIKQDANSQYDGQYIFAGTLTTTQPYTSASDAYNGNSGAGAAIYRQIGPGATLQINTDISSVLGNGQPDNKLLSVLDDISQHLQGGTAADQTALSTTDLQNLDANLQTLQGMQASVGATQDRLQLASGRIQDLQLSTTTTLSNTEDADFAQTSIDFSTAQAAYNAALQSSAKIIQDSLLNFLQ